ncbi:PREDICTED: uncharacterized protein LOC108367779 [Rhagoletis zephyria]|uniref:uncharacterized protein LOC108367779 n=1 Tax=Rhagoletis zephyria TaxID=28612 RepID=UPI000811A672|nr:PREDICTED: uncharacterized protein LOC108367779 [Rhagoletis zephyria]XP_036317586.1 uncharacterized protein LOC118732562 [Rhagoletis pomonella]
MKPLTVPRLELQAGVLGTRILSCIRDEHSVDFERCILWSDSTAVIRWIRSEHRRYKPFVQHRVAEILAATNVSSWKWLPTALNVADEATRMNNRLELGPTARWSRGPPFLQQPQHTWPTDDPTVCNTDEPDEELRPKHVLVIVNLNLFEFKRFSTFNKLARVAAWVLRFINTCRRNIQQDQCFGLTAREIEFAKGILCRLVQREAFATEIQQIESNQNIARTSTLLQLSPYIDEEGILRVKGRIDNASWLPISSRRPVILPSNHD